MTPYTLGLGDDGTKIVGMLVEKRPSNAPEQCTTGSRTCAWMVFLLTLRSVVDDQISEGKECVFFTWDEGPRLGRGVKRARTPMDHSN